MHMKNIILSNYIFAKTGMQNMPVLGWSGSPKNTLSEIESGAC